MAGPGTDNRTSPPAESSLEPVSIHEYALPFSGGREKCLYIKRLYNSSGYLKKSPLKKPFFVVPFRRVRG
jgi:hypothetical protein